MEVGQGPNWGCSVKGKKIILRYGSNFQNKVVLPKKTREVQFMTSLNMVALP
jgi:hypothetical protein